MPTEARCHIPAEKPAALIKVLIEVTTPLGGLVVDCFAGSGIVGKVAQRLGREALLIDLRVNMCASRLLHECRYNQNSRYDLLIGGGAVTEILAAVVAAMLLFALMLLLGAWLGHRLRRAARWPGYPQPVGSGPNGSRTGQQPVRHHSLRAMGLLS